MSRGKLVLRFSVLLAVLFLGTAAFSFGAKKAQTGQSFTFVQLSDTHWGFNDPKYNPDYAGTMKKAIDEINGLKVTPDFIVITGDLTHTVDDPKVRRERMAGFKSVITGFQVTNIYLLAGEHDAALDNGQAYQEYFGKTFYAFDHKGVHFVAIDNVSDPTGKIGDSQLQWLDGVLKGFKKNDKIIVFTHRPLFDLYPKWDWWTPDGSKALDLLKPYKNVMIFYGHIHQYNLRVVDRKDNYAAKGMMFQLPAPGSLPKKIWIPWDNAHPYKGLGFRVVEVSLSGPENTVTEYPIAAKNDGPAETVIKVTAKKFVFTPNEIRLKVGVPVVIELTTQDVTHGFSVPDMNINEKIEPGKTTRIRIVPDKKGKFDFNCSVFCGSGHEDMTGTIIVE